MGYAIFGVIVIVAGVFAWLSWPTWRWHNVVLAFLIVCASAVFAYLSAYTLSVHKYWRTQVAARTGEIAKEEVQVTEFEIGKLDQESGELRDGIRQLTQEVQDLVVRRGPAWFDVAMVRKPNAKGMVELSIEAPEPHGLPENAVVFAFEADPIAEKGAYLGEFIVSKAPADSKNVVLTPNMPMSEKELARLVAAKNVWTIFQKMPADENDVFAALSKEQAAAILPDDLPEGFAEGKRPIEEMSDYTFLFHQYALQRGLLEDSVAKIENTIARLTEAEKRNQAKIAYREQEKADLTFDKAGFNAELVAVKQYRTSLETLLQKLTKDVAAVKANNIKLAAQLKQLELKAADRINRQTETAQAEPAGVAP